MLYSMFTDNIYKINLNDKIDFFFQNHAKKIVDLGYFVNITYLYEKVMIGRQRLCMEE